MARITHEKVVDALTKYRRSRRINRATVYLKTNDIGDLVPVCLVGHVLHELGVDPKPLYRHNQDSIDGAALRIAIKMPEQTRELLYRIQKDCDSGAISGRRPTWGAAIRKHLPSEVS